MPVRPSDDFWPKSLAHLGRPFVADTDKDVVIGEITSEPNSGSHGIRMRCTALVPKQRADAVLKTRGGIGHGVQSNGPHPCVGPDGGYRPSFWIGGPRGSKFDPLVYTWLNHNKTVLVPDNGFLMCYGLVPRLLKDGSISWDDPSRPVYDVVRVIPLSDYSVGGGHTTARITIQRDYLEDYLSLRGCVAIATYFEERYSSDDPEIEALLEGGEGSNYELPGRELWIKRSPAERLGNQLSEVWGCALLLAPKARPLSGKEEQRLTWPDRKAPISGHPRGGFGTFERAYVRDEVLVAYEKHLEFDVNPEYGSVSYDGWWSVSSCRRHGRNHIEMELRKLYEGATSDVIKHFNNFAIPRELAERDREIYGTRHIGDRAKEVIAAFLQLTATLAQLSDSIGLCLTQADVGRLTTADVNYKGWWTLPELRPLGHVVPWSLSFQDFLVRCEDLFKLFENLGPSPLRGVLIRLGVGKDVTKDFKSLKLLETICQLSTIAVTNGLDLILDSSQICAEWDKSAAWDRIRPLFALNDLRVSGAHLSGRATEAKIGEALTVFGIDQNQCRSGWGKALDNVYDRVLSSLQDIEKLIRQACR